MKSLARWLILLTGVLAGTLSSTHARVVINEVMYHPPDDRDELQWIELHNTGDQPANLAGWSITQGVRFTFTNAFSLPARGFVVVARDRGAFILRYGTHLPVVGDFRGRLSHGGERLELTDPSGKTVDSLEFSDAPPWPVSPDGLSPSLERIVPTSAGEDPGNWAPSPLPPLRGAAGSPGQTNAAFATNLPPIIRGVRLPTSTPSQPQPVEITAEASDPDGLEQLILFYRTLAVLETAGTGRNPADAPATTETALPMSLTAGTATEGTYAATLPALPPNQLIRIRIEAVDRAGSRRIAPHPNDARPTWSFLSSSPSNHATVPFAFLAQHGTPERPGQSLRTMDWNPRRGRRQLQPAEPARGDATFVYLAPGESNARVFDHIRITPRQGGWKVRLLKDQLVDGMSTVNVLFEYQPRFVLAEHLAFETYRAAGVPTPLSGHWRTWYNGRPVGYHLFVEQPNSSFLRRVDHDPDGDLFKLLWYGGDLIGQHEKKNNPETGHAPLVETVEALNTTSGPQRWREIERRFNVPEFVNYYAVNMLIQNWDGFFNNYFLYRPPGAAGKWEIIPWDEDKTWGGYDGASPQYDWYTMPLSFGMAGDRPKMSLTERFFGQGGPHGGQSWWRQPGWFSGPLLADPEFRTRFKARLRELLETQFTPEKMEPLIAHLERTLRPEVRYRAEVVGASHPPDNAPPFGEVQDEGTTSSGETGAALNRFQRHIDSFRRQVKHRREFLLQELARER